jgi:hypothetical protein
MTGLGPEDSERLDEFKRLFSLVEDAVEAAARKTRMGAYPEGLNFGLMDVVVREDSRAISAAWNRGERLEPDLRIRVDNGITEIVVLRPRLGIESVYLPALARELEARGLKVRVSPMSTDKLLSAQPTVRGAAEGQGEQAAVSEQKAKLEKPGKGDSLDEWFAYYHACKKSRVKYTLQDLANDVNLSHGYVRQEHAKYIAEHRDEQDS